MQKKQSSEQEELLQSQNNVNVADNKNYNLATNEPIDGTPFRLIGTKENGYFIVLGKYRITEIKETEGEALELLITNNWDIIAALILIFIREDKNENWSDMTE